MKSLKTSLLIAALALSSITFATEVKEGKETKTITDEISTLLKNPNFTVENEFLAKVDFMLNQDKEIVVLAVNGSNSEIENFIKNRLNYRTISSSNVKLGEHIIVPVRFKTQE